MPGTRFSITLPPGGVDPLGEATVWESELDWEALPTEDLRQGDRVSVDDLGPEGSYGIAEYNGVDWQLAQGFFQSEADLNEFTEIVGLEASAYVLSGTDLQDGEGKFYYYDGAAWVRTPKDTGYVYPQVADLTELLAIPEPKETDRVLVLNTGFATYGWADFAGGDWYLDKGAFPTVANMESFLTTAAVDPKDAAVAIVPTGIVGTDPDSIYYVYSEADLEWQRTPLGTHYIWPQVANWAALSTRSYSQPSDEVHVQSLGTSLSSGTAHKHSGAWRLIEGRWASVSDMNNWRNVPLGQLIHADARALVDPSNAWDENAVPYYWSGSVWVQAGGVSGVKTHTITSIYDFSASGLTDGDYGVLTPAAAGSSPIVLRYKAACTIAAGGTRAVWMTPTAYAGTPVLYAWTDGTESNGTLASQGWTVSIGTGCTLIPTGGYQRMATPSTQVSVSLATMSGAITAATKIESIYECRGSIPGGTPVRSIQFYLADGTGYSIGDSGQGGATGYGYRQSGAGGIANTPIRDVLTPRIPALAATPFVCVARDEGRTVLASLSVNGNAFADYRRSLGSIVGNIIYVYVTGEITAPITMDYRGQILTY